MDDMVIDHSELTIARAEAAKGIVPKVPPRQPVNYTKQKRRADLKRHLRDRKIAQQKAEETGEFQRGIIESTSRFASSFRPNRVYSAPSFR